MAGYKSQLNLISDYARKDPKLYAFLVNLDTAAVNIPNANFGFSKFVAGIKTIVTNFNTISSAVAIQVHGGVAGEFISYTASGGDVTFSSSNSSSGSFFAYIILQ